MFPYKRLVVKIGSNVLTRENGLPDLERMDSLVKQISGIKKQAKEVILVSSGAVAAGRSLIKISKKVDDVTRRQLLSSVGQVKLINTYSGLFSKQGLLCSQVLVTKEDFRDRLHYLNMQNCFEGLLQHDVIPVVNENDVISVTELMFTDNDELAGLIASMLNADALIILTNVDGIYNGDPDDAASEVIREINSGNLGNFRSYITAGKSEFGRGGMMTKGTMAIKIARLGIAVHIANGKKENILPDLLHNNAIHTRFVPHKTTPGRKKWIAHAENTAKGAAKINAGAKQALYSDKATSLLPVGITDIRQEFQKGDIIKLLDEHDRLIGVGRAEYSSEKARERIGRKNEKPLVHYDYLFLNFDMR